MLLADAQFFQKKARISEKIRAQLERTGEALKAELSRGQLPALPHDSLSVQFVKGEHLENFPYQYLDCPKYFHGPEKRTFRTLVWWGHYVACAWLLEGRLTKQYKARLVDRFHTIAGQHLELSLAPTLWEWKRGEGYTLPITHDRKAQTAAVLAERSILIGLVVPGDLILALGGVYAAKRQVDLAWVIAIGIVGATIGESIGYWLGRRYGMSLIRRIPFLNRLAPALQGAQEYFARHGGKTVAIGRYATAAGAFIPFTAGMARMPYRRFLLFDVPAIVVWAVGISIFGYVFGENLAFVDRVISRFGYVVLGLILVILVLWFVRKRRQRDSAEPEPDQVDQDSSPR